MASPYLPAAAPKRMHQCHQHPRAGRAEGMSQRDGAAVDIDLGWIQVELSDARDSLSGEGLVQFDQIQLCVR